MEWKSAKADRVLAALLRIGWSMKASSINNYAIFRPLHHRLEVLLSREIPHRTYSTPHHFARSQYSDPARIGTESGTLIYGRGLNGKKDRIACSYGAIGRTSYLHFIDAKRLGQR